MKIPDEIFAVAKESVITLGRFQPTVFVLGTQGKVYMPLPFGETSDDRVAIMAQAGIQCAEAGRIGEVERIIFVSEAWVSPARQSYTLPSQDPNRQEVVLFNSLDARTNAQELEIYTCTRQGRQVIDLKLLEQPRQSTVEGRLLPAFLAGFRLFKR